MTAVSASIGYDINLENSVTLAKSQSFSISQTADSGSDAYTVFLTNESHTFPAANDGTVDSSDLADGLTEVRVFKGTTQYTNDNNSPYDANSYRAVISKVVSQWILLK